MKKLIVIGGATATGKTAWAIRLAQLFGTEIISADSRQCYIGMDIGSAKPTPDELAAAPHHFISAIQPDQPFSAGDFARQAAIILERIFSQNDRAIVAGGSGLFIRALCEGMDEFPDISPQTRAYVAEQERARGLAWLQAELETRDPRYYAQVDRNNPARLRRALEVCIESGLPYSDFRQARPAPLPYAIQYILLTLPRPTLYARIDRRVDAMMAQGLEAEARALLPYRQYPALRTVGYQELFDYFDGLHTLEQAVEKIKQHSRNYAKRQETWFRKYGVWTPAHPDDEATILQIVKDH